MDQQRFEHNLNLYLLGELSESDQFEFEREYLANEEAYENYLAAQDELIENYLADELTAHEKKCFENRFLISEERRSRFKLFKDLTLHATAAAAVAQPAKQIIMPQKPPVSSVSWLNASTRRLSEWFGTTKGWQMTLASGVAAALVLASAFGVWLLIRQQLPNGVQVSRVESPTVSSPKPEVLLQPSPTESNAGNSVAVESNRKSIPERRDTPNSSSRVEPKPTAKPTAEQSSRERINKTTIFSFALTPMIIVRGNARVTNEVVIPSNAKFVKIELILNNAVLEQGNVLQAEVRTAEGQPVWEDNRIRLHVAADSSDKKAALQIPAPQLPVNNYIIILSSPETQEIVRYSFNVRQSAKK